MRGWFCIVVVGASIAGYYRDGYDRIDFCAGFIAAMAMTRLMGYRSGSK